MSFTLIIIIITCLVSFVAFNNQKVMDDLIFDPPAVYHDRQYYRFFTCGFIHADYAHLIFNMYSFYIFGEAVEQQFRAAFGEYGKWLFLLMYLSSLFFCLLPTYSKNKENYNYRSLGASGAVAAVVFAFIFLAPTMKLSLIFLPGLGIPGFVFGLLYLVISSYLDKRGGGNINHSAHIWGALYGLSFLIVFGSFLAKTNLLKDFISSVKYYFQTL
ncbi:MAG: rhomboid family intramembrane serine protease [Gemmatimonadaceae bacterium]|nr:rhomboid family intramembrane serine protease [Chitinophagaceae bacterium]